MGKLSSAVRAGATAEEAKPSQPVRLRRLQLGCAQSLPSYFPGPQTQGFEGNPSPRTPLPQSSQETNRPSREEAPSPGLGRDFCQSALLGDKAGKLQRGEEKEGATGCLGIEGMWPGVAYFWSRLTLDC
jgi:hypothetical protein